VTRHDGVGLERFDLVELSEPSLAFARLLRVGRPYMNIAEDGDV